MIYIIKRFILLRLKNLENLLRTQKLNTETRKAYRSRNPLHTVVHYLTTIMVILSVLVAFAGIFYIGIKSYSGIGSGVKSFLVNIKDGATKQKINKPTSKDIGTADKKEIVPTKKIEPKPHGMPFFIFVNKNTKKFYLLKNVDEHWKIFRKYDIGIGADPQRKEKTRDNRTPEGQYFIIGRKEKSELTKIYGPLAFVLNYPNEIDKREGRTGYGIWIHGTDPEKLPYKSKGCLELLNRDATELGVILKDGIGTPVLIVNIAGLDSIISYPDYNSIAIKRKEIIARYEDAKKMCEKFVNDWSYSWQSRNIEKYSSFYDTLNFSGQGLRWEKWRKKKAATFDYYKKIDIKISNLFLSEQNDRMLTVKFLQDYRSDKIHSVSGKKLKLVKIGSEWRITSENSFPRQELLL